MIAVVPRYPASDGPLSGPPSRIGQLRAIRMLRLVAPDRVAVFDLENNAGTPIYVHAKICIVDDTWITCGSDNFNRRSWTTDSELTCAVLDSTSDSQEPSGPEVVHDASRRLARDLRFQLWAEHLSLDQDNPRLHDQAAGLELWKTTADGLDRWHQSGRRGPRPTGHVRHHTPEPVPAHPTTLGGPGQPPRRGPRRPSPPAARDHSVLVQKHASLELSHPAVPPSSGGSCMSSTAGCPSSTAGRTSLRGCSTARWMPNACEVTETRAKLLIRTVVSFHSRPCLRTDGLARRAQTDSVFGERDTIRGGEPDARTVHSGRSFEFTIARLTSPSRGALHALSESYDYESCTSAQRGDDL
jgi:hypothetical protein